jgi:hypothetical protein
MVKKTNVCDVYYGRTLISIISVLALLEKKKNYNKKILYINNNDQKVYKNHLNKKFLDFFKIFLKRYFDEIHYIDYSRNLRKKNNFFSKIFERSKNIKLNLKKIDFKIEKNFKISNVYAGGDDFENTLLNKLGYFPKFHYLEHGYGPLRDSIYFPVKLKHQLFKSLIKFFYHLKIISYYPIKYQSYVGILVKYISSKKFMNQQLINENNNIDLHIILSKLSKYTLQNKKIKKNKLNYVLFNYSAFCISKEKKEFNDLLNKISSLINKKKECILIKGHPVYSSIETEKFIKSMIVFLKKNKIKYYLIKKDSFLKNMPSQIIVKIFKIKKVISDLSTVPFHLGCKKRNIKCYLPLDYAIRNQSHNFYQNRDEKFKDFFYKMGKNVTFI